jgi:5'-3' exonuclease
LEPNETYLLDIPELARVIADDMNNGLPQEVNRTYDYIFLCFFLGNDFMPHFPSVNIRTGGINKMLNAYKATIGGTTEILTDGKTIYWKNVKKLIQHLAKSEEDHLKSEMKLRDKRSQQFYPSDTPENKLKKFDAIPTYERQLEKSINPFKPKWQERYYKALFKVEIDDTRRAQISINYLEGLEWTMKYYTSGCPNWQWSYKYSYPPLLEDLIEFIPSLDTVLMENVPPNPISPLVQLCYVLPKQSLTLLPEPLYNALMLDHPEWYNTNCDFVWAFCRYFWESHVELPEIDITELAEFVKININRFY